MESDRKIFLAFVRSPGRDPTPPPPTPLLQSCLPSRQDEHKTRGTWVPGDIMERVRSDPEALHDKDKATTASVLWKRFPNISEEDHAALHELYYALFLASTAPASKHYHAYTTRLYVLDKYTDFKFNAPLAMDREAIGRAHQKADEIIAAWKGESGAEGDQEPVGPEHEDAVEPREQDAVDPKEQGQ